MGEKRTGGQVKWLEEGVLVCFPESSDFAVYHRIACRSYKHLQKNFISEQSIRYFILRMRGKIWFLIR